MHGMIRAIYYIFDMSLNKRYAGSAYGKENLLQPWVEDGIETRC